MDATQTILTDRAISVSELKKNPSALMENQTGMPVAILNHNRVMAYLVSAKRYEELMEYIDDLRLTISALERTSDGAKAVPMSIEELAAIAEPQARSTPRPRRKGKTIAA